MDEPVDETGMLMRVGGGFALRCDGGRLLRLELYRTPVDLVGKRVRVIGRSGEGETVAVEGVQPG